MLKELSLNNTIFKVSIADNDDSRYKGLSGLPKLGKAKGMLFIFNKPIIVNMVMRDMNFPLDFIFLDDKWNIIQLDTLDKDDKIGVQSSKPVSMVLEVNKDVIKNLNLKIGMTLKPSSDLSTHQFGVVKFEKGGTFQKIGDIVYEVKEDDIKLEKDKLQILNDKGEIVSNIDGGARIFSREHTKDIIKAGKKKDSKELGKIIVDIIDTHSKQSPDFVTTK